MCFRNWSHFSLCISCLWVELLYTCLKWWLFPNLYISHKCWALSWLWYVPQWWHFLMVWVVFLWIASCIAHCFFFCTFHHVRFFGLLYSSLLQSLHVHSSHPCQNLVMCQLNGVLDCGNLLDYLKCYCFVIYVINGLLFPLPITFLIIAFVHLNS